jgi:ABC-2 type transport system ATP-binding protein
VIIRTESLNKTFRKQAAVRDLSLSVPEGSVYALIGANGAGKTTTIKTVLNILMPTSGCAEVLGVDSRRLSPREYARIGYVSESQELPGRMSVRAYLDYLRPFYPDWDGLLEGELIAEFQLPLNARIRDLSHGTRMKMNFTCALSYRPELLVLDEPFGGLDALVRDELMHRLLQQVQEMTVFVSSHELEEIEGSATYVGYIEEGRLIFQEPMESLSARVRSVRVTLADSATPLAAPPSSWIDIEASGSVLSFIDLNYSAAALSAALNTKVAGIREVLVEPVGLRSIFTALARSSRVRRAM